MNANLQSNSPLFRGTLAQTFLEDPFKKQRTISALFASMGLDVKPPSKGIFMDRGRQFTGSESTNAFEEGSSLFRPESTGAIAKVPGGGYRHLGRLNVENILRGTVEAGAPPNPNYAGGGFNEKSWQKNMDFYNRFAPKAGVFEDAETRRLARMREMVAGFDRPRFNETGMQKAMATSIVKSADQSSVLDLIRGLMNVRGAIAQKVVN